MQAHHSINLLSHRAHSTSGFREQMLGTDDESFCPACRLQDLCVLASELCNLELYGEHAALIRTAVESAIPACRKLQGPELSCLAHACGVLQNVEKDRMMVQPYLCRASQSKFCMVANTATL